MANITRFNPFRELESFDPFSDDFFKGFALRPVFRQLESEPQMRLDVTEDEKAYTVKAEIPGVNKEDIKVSIEGSQVSISAEVKNEKEVKEGDKLLRSERYFGRLSRSFSLGQEVDDASVVAKYNNGVLELQLPKRSIAKSRRIAIE